MRNAAVNYIIALLLLVVASFEASRFFQQWSYPFTYHWAEARPARIVVGDQLTMVYRFTRHRICQVDLNRFISTVSDNSVVWRDRVAGGATSTGVHTVINKITLPSNIGPGMYTMNTFTHAQCHNGTYAVAAPTATFEIVASQ